MEGIPILPEVLLQEQYFMITVSDTLAGDTDVESDVVEQIGQEQLHKELWDLVSQVLKDDKKAQLLKWRYIDSLTLEEIANRYKVSRANIHQLEVQSLRKLRSNSKTKRIGIELGLWEKDSRISASKIKEWVSRGHINWLSEKDLEYARRMGWVGDELVQK